MEKTKIEGLSIQPDPPELMGELKAPIIYLDNGLTLDDSILQQPTLLLGPVGTGKSFLLEKMMVPILLNAEENNDNVIIFCAKPDFLKYKRPQDSVISVDATSPEACWNIFSELANSKNHKLTARDIAAGLIKSQRSQLTPFFTNAACDILYNTIECMFENQQLKGEQYSNWHLVDFLQNTSLSKKADLSWYDLADLRPEYFGHILDYLGDDLGQAYGVISELRTLIFEVFWGSFCSDEGTFSAIKAMKSGGNRIFLYYDYANSSEASIKIYRTILNLLLKHSLNCDNNRKNWFIIDEASLLPATCIADAMSLGRSAGFRLIMALQSAELMTRHYKRDEAKTLLSLFPNIICMKVQDSFSRSIISDRYGQALYSYVWSESYNDRTHTEYRPVVSDSDFAQLNKKGDAICSIPNLSNSPFLYHGYRKELDV